MISATLENSGTCFVCQETVDIDYAMHHLQNCGLPRVSLKTEQVFVIRVITEDKFWMFIEAAGATTLTNLYLFLRNNWFECCGHMSEFIVDGVDSDSNYMDKTLNDMFVYGKKFHYEHNAGEPMRVSGEVVAVRSSLLSNNMNLLLRKIIPEERCDTCLETAQ
jgi:hypothetical protein